ncbi:MAG: hypothetical protein Edafosvirus10_5 [Edafosvirus sp.]|uniref:Uncharacterized protein n=1 Tax=Edafosvirus sp. TaxID=2487765 RepID=A0A3G4ZTV0_9VIRU|nr:MAG: hypothetical protein Edafosvirus10_5 [Edafosvirus sp.]
MDRELRSLDTKLADLEKKITSNVGQIIKYRTWNDSLFSYFTNNYVHSLTKQTSKDYHDYKNIHIKIMMVYDKYSGLMNPIQKNKIDQLYANRLKSMRDQIASIGLDFVDDFKKSEPSDMDLLQ